MGRYARLFGILFLLVLTPLAGRSQLYSDFNPEDFKHEYPVNVYFGSVKDRDGNYVEGATVILRADRLDFVAVTDHLGRFRMELPVEITHNQVEPGCSRTGYASAWVFTRPPRGEALSPVEINCVLQ